MDQGEEKTKPQRYAGIRIPEFEDDRYTILEVSIGKKSE
jgi:hypothetical protein